LANAHKDIFEVKQLRLVISNSKHISIGMIDLFDFDFKNKRAGVGIIVKAAEDRKKGYGSEALTLLTKYCKSQLDLHQLYCNISEENEASLIMFQNQGFEIVGLKKDWNFIHGAFKNEYLLQHILR
jgi:diamine N-acetyltransferase